MNNTGYSNMDNMFGKQFEPYVQTNKWQVQNLQDALSRYSPPNSRGVYYYTDADVEYECEIYTDANGRKTYQVYKRVLCTDINIPQSVDVNKLLERISKLEEQLNAKSTTNFNDGPTKMQQPSN